MNLKASAGCSLRVVEGNQGIELCLALCSRAHLGVHMHLGVITVSGSAVGAACSLSYRWQSPPGLTKPQGLSQDISDS